MSLKLVEITHSPQVDALSESVQLFWKSLFEPGNELFVSFMLHYVFDKSLCSKCTSVSNACEECHFKFMRNLIKLKPRMRLLCVTNRGIKWNMSLNPFGGEDTWSPLETSNEVLHRATKMFVPHFYHDASGYCSNAFILSCFKGDEMYFSFHGIVLCLGVYYVLTKIASENLIHSKRDILSKIIDYVGKKLGDERFASDLKVLLKRSFYSHEIACGVIRNKVKSYF